MKNRIFLLALAVFSLFISVNMGTQKALAQVPCDPCESVTSWTKDSTFIQGPGLNCAWEVKYRYKVCPATKDDPAYTTLEIISIDLISGGTCLMTDQAVMTMAIKKILFNAFPIAGGSSPNTVKVKTPTCLERSTASGTKIIPCEETDCCLNEYKLIQENNITMIDSIKTNTVGTNCGNPIMNECTNMCDIASNLELNTYLDPGYPGYITCGCNEPWTSYAGNSITKTVASCNMTAYYETRNCNGTTEVLIKYLTSTGTCDLTTLMRNAIGKIISQLGNPNPVVFRFRTCWESSTPENLTYFYPCGPETCCSVTYTNGAGSVSSQGMNCLPFSACEFICDSDLESFVSAKRSSEIHLKLEGTKTFIVPNPSKGATDLHFVSEYSGEVSVSIVDNLGNVVFEQQFTKDKSELIYNFDSSKLAKGAYHFYLSTGIIPLSSGSFIVE